MSVRIECGWDQKYLFDMFMNEEKDVFQFGFYDSIDYFSFPESRNVYFMGELRVINLEKFTTEIFCEF